MLPRIYPRTSSLTALCITHCSNMSICLLFLICLYLSSFMLSNSRFVPRQFYSLFVNIVRALSAFILAFSCFSVSFQLICSLSYYSFLNTSVLLKLLFFTVSSIYALLNWFLLLIVNWLIMKQTWMFNLYNKDI